MKYSALSLTSSASLYRSAVVSLSLGLLTLIIAVSPSLQQQLQFDSGAIASGEVWRFLTGHFTHWNLDHFVWDFSVFLVLSVLCERRSRLAYLFTVAKSAVAISAWMMSYPAGLATYRGLSGIDTGLFCLCCLQILDEARERRDGLLQATAALALVGAGSKVLWELSSQATLFVDHISADFVPVPMAHLWGGVCGFVIGVLFCAAQHGHRLLKLSLCDATDCRIAR